MREMPLEQFAQDVPGWIEAAQLENIVVTRNGQPLAVVLGIENKDEEDWRLEISPEFWQMIQERRQEPTIPLKDLEAELFADD